MSPPEVAVFKLPCATTDDGPSAAPEPADREWVEPLLQQNAIWFCRLRWIVVAVLGVASVTAYFPGRSAILGLDRSAALPLGAAAVLAALNLVFVRLAHEAARAGAGRSVGPLLWAQIVTDLLVLTAVIHWLGHEVAVAPFMYLFHVILACVVFTPGASLGVAGLAAAFYLAMLLLESSGLLAANRTVSSTASTGGLAPSVPGSLGFQVWPMLWIWAVIWYLVSRLATALRSRDRDLYLSNRRLRASIEERSNHMLQTTHQLKAPFAAIHAQTQLLVGGYCGPLSEKVGAVVGRISERCLVLSRQIQEMLQLANLRSQGQSAPRPRPLQLERLIEETLVRLEPAAQQRGIRLERQLDPVSVMGVADHLTMVVDNLVVNAVTYSHPRGVVRVACRPGAKGGAVLEVKDAGIGIPCEKLPHVFEDYYRTEEAVRHNRASTGLGLAIVRQVACRDQLGVVVESAPGWGTRFAVTIPGARPDTTPPAHVPGPHDPPRAPRPSCAAP